MGPSSPWCAVSCGRWRWAEPEFTGSIESRKLAVDPADPLPLQVSHGAIQFMVYEELRALALRLNPRHQQPMAAPGRHGLLAWRKQVTQRAAFAASPAAPSGSAPAAMICRYKLVLPAGLIVYKLAAGGTVTRAVAVAGVTCGAAQPVMTV